MPRSRPTYLPDDLRERDDSASLSGLADVLEPELDAITPLRLTRRAPPALSERRLGTPARAPSLAPPPVADFAFADTVFADDLPEDAAPPSTSADRDLPPCLTPLAFPLPPPSAPVDLPTRLRVLAAEARHHVVRSRDEMRELWAGTSEIVSSEDGHPGASPSLPVVVRRVLALWACFQWSRADLARAATIGLAVFVTAAVIGATTLGPAAPDAPATAARSAEVRAGRTLDQHTGSPIGVHGKH
jgi:hypothetical protein